MGHWDRIELVQGDITKEAVDAIVNAANRTLLGGGGVDGAIHNAAGPELLKECETLGGCDTGDAKITAGYRLRAKHVIHSVGPVWRGGKRREAELLASCYSRSIDVAVKNNLRTLSFPAISCGAYGYPIDEAATVALGAVNAALEKAPEIAKVRFVLFDQKILATFRAAYETLKAADQNVHTASADVKQPAKENQS